MSFFGSLFGSDTPDDDLGADEEREFVCDYLAADDVAGDEYLHPDIVAKASWRFWVTRNDINVNDFAIEDVDPPRVTVLVNQIDGAWMYRKTFRVARHEGTLRIVPRLHGSWLDPWQESTTLEEDLHFVFVLLDSPDASVTADTPKMPASALGLGNIPAYDGLRLERREFEDHLEVWLQDDTRTPAEAEELDRLAEWIIDHPQPVVGVLIEASG